SAFEPRCATIHGSTGSGHPTRPHTGCFYAEPRTRPTSKADPSQRVPISWGDPWFRMTNSRAASANRWTVRPAGLPGLKAEAIRKTPWNGLYWATVVKFQPKCPAAPTHLTSFLRNEESGDCSAQLADSSRSLE